MKSVLDGASHIGTSVFALGKFAVLGIPIQILVEDIFKLRVYPITSVFNSLYDQFHSWIKRFEANCKKWTLEGLKGELSGSKTEKLSVWK